jgi:hypothetical protein
MGALPARDRGGRGPCEAGFDLVLVQVTRCKHGDQKRRRGPGSTQRPRTCASMSETRGHGSRQPPLARRSDQFPGMEKPAQARVGSRSGSLARREPAGFGVRAAPRDDTCPSEREREDFTFPEGGAGAGHGRGRFWSVSRSVKAVQT